MTDILTTVLPVFGLIIVGYLAVRMKRVKASSAEGLTQYVFVIAVPALLFRTMVDVSPPVAAPWGLWGAYFGAVFITWALTVMAARALGMLPGEESASAAMSSGFSNLVMLGLPIVYAHYGPEAAIAAALIISIHAPLQWMGATLAIEWQRQSDGVHWGVLFKGLARDLLSNPIVFALLMGSLWRQTGLGLTPVLHSMLTLLGESGVPAALVALGFSLAALPLAGQIRPALLIVGMKMLAMPLLAFGLAHYVFDLPPLWQAVSVLFASLPTGANGFLFAMRYQAAVAPVSAAIGIGTAMAAVTTPLLLWGLDHFLN